MSDKEKKNKNTDPDFDGNTWMSGEDRRKKSIKIDPAMDRRKKEE